MNDQGNGVDRVVWSRCDRHGLVRLYTGAETGTRFAAEVRAGDWRVVDAEEDVPEIRGIGTVGKVPSPGVGGEEKGRTGCGRLQTAGERCR